MSGRPRLNLQRLAPWVSAAVLGLCVAVSCGVVSWVSWWTLNGESQAFVDQAIGDTSNTLSNFVSIQLSQWKDELSEVVRSKGPASATPSTMQVVSVEMPPHFLQISVWRKLSVDPAATHTKIFTGRNVSAIASAEVVKKYQEMAAKEAEFATNAFKGRWVLHAFPGVMMIAGPRQGLPLDVQVAFIRADGFQKAFSNDGLVRATLVDSKGSVLAHPQLDLVGTSMADNPLVKSFLTSSLNSGQLAFEGTDGVQYFGGYRRIASGEAQVMVSVSRAEVKAGAKLLTKRTMILSTALFFLFGFLGYRVVGSKISSTYAQIEELNNPNKDPNTLDRMPIDRRSLTVLHGSLRGLDHVLESAGPEEVAEVIRGYFEIVKARVHEYSGVFERYSGTTFVAVWGTRKNESNESWRAIRAALDLRMDFSLFNENRKINGKKPLISTMGVHSGMALAAKLGPEESMSFTLVGGAHGIAKSLDQMALMAGNDLLVSHSSWHSSDGLFDGEQVGEAKMGQDAAMVTYYKIRGYRDELGKSILVETSYAQFEQDSPTSFIQYNSQTEKAKRWLVNNGSQIIGPMSPEQIASALFAQDLDFDCECWAEGTGKSSKIETAGIFTGSEDKDATLWVYDGRTIHGPLSRGFLATAVQRGAISAERSYFCESSTVSGWRLLNTWAGLTNGRPADSKPSNQAA